MKRLTVCAIAIVVVGPMIARGEAADSRQAPAQASVPAEDSSPKSPPNPPAVDPAVLQAEAQRVDAMERVKGTVLAIFAPTGQGGGSGVVISADGYALTNFHVVQPCGYAMKCGMADGQLYDAVIVGSDPTGDIALIKLFGRDDFPHPDLGDSDALQVGETCFAMGNPFLLATDFQPTVTYGIISGTHRYQYPAGTLLEYADCIQTSASINPGNSGGPLFDSQGRLIGINGRGSFEKRGRVNVGVAYAVSINQIKNFLGHLRGGRIVDHATLGAQVAFDEDNRVIVTNILEDCDAYRRGLRYGDEITSFAGRPISTPNGFKNALGIFPRGWRVPLTYRREEKRYDVLVRLQGVHGEEELLQKLEGRSAKPSMPIPKPGDQPDPNEPRKPAAKPKPGEKDQPGRLPEAAEDDRKPEDSKPAKTPQPPGKPRPKIEPIPGPDGGVVMAQAPPMPEVVKKHFEAKRGFANYFFNRQQRDRVWKSWAARGDFATCTGPWTVHGELEGGGTFTLSLGEDDGSLQLPAGETKWSVSDDLGSSLLPLQSGGLMPALYLWRRLAVHGPDKFGDVSYLGTVPLKGREGLVDALVGVHKGVDCVFLFDPAKGHLLALELYPASDVDPCEVYFSGYHDVGGRDLPARMEVRVGDDLYAIFRLDPFKLDQADKK